MDEGHGTGDWDGGQTLLFLVIRNLGLEVKEQGHFGRMMDQLAEAGLVVRSVSVSKGRQYVDLAYTPVVCRWGENDLSCSRGQLPRVALENAISG